MHCRFEHVSMLTLALCSVQPHRAAKNSSRILVLKRMHLLTTEVKMECVQYLTIKQSLSVCLYVCLYVCTFVLRLVLEPLIQFHFILGGCIGGDSMKCIVTFGAIWKCDTFNI